MTLRPRLRALLTTTLLSAGLLAGVGLSVATAAPAGAADGWVDGGDEFPCLDDVTCLWIENCELDENQHPVYPNRNGTTSYPAGTYSYADEQPTTPPPTPTPTPTPTNPGSGGGSGTGNGGSSGGSTGTPTAPGGTGTTGGTTTVPGAVPGAPVPGAAVPGAPTAPVVAPGAPTAPAAPTLSVKGRSVTVTWAATANAELEQVTGYLIRFTGLAAIEVDGATLTHTFTKLRPGSYRAAVWAKNAAGESPGSLPSEPVVVGADPSTVAGTVTVDGELTPGATVNLTGTGFAPRIEGFAVELHSDPVALATVTTDDRGGFTSQVVVPATVAPGDHQIVVLYDGVEVSRSPVTVAGAAGAAPVADADVATTGTNQGSGDPVPANAGVVILGALAATGALALVWRLLRGRRARGRVAVPLATGSAVPHAS